METRTYPFTSASERKDDKKSADRSRERNQPGYLLRPKGSQWQGRLGVSLRRGGFGTSALGVLPATESPRRPLSLSRRRRRRRQRWCDGGFAAEGAAGRSRGHQDPGIGGGEAVRQPPNPPPSTVWHPPPHPLGVDGGEERGGRGRRRGRTRPGITTTVDAARYFWRQVDTGLTCVRSCGLPACLSACLLACQPPRIEGVLERTRSFLPSTSGSSTGGSSTLSCLPVAATWSRYG